MKAFTKEELQRSMRLYAVTDRHWLKEKETLEDKCREALRGGITFLQLREKDADRAFVREEAEELQKLCREKHIPFVIDDDIELAAELGLDGVHVGQKDLLKLMQSAGRRQIEDMAADQAVLRVREIIGEDRILGVSAETVEEAVLAEKAGADYLGVGTVFPTSSKDDAIPVSHETLRAICNAVSIPVVAIGGITRDNLQELRGTGIDGIAVISAIFGQPDIQKASEDLFEKTACLMS